MKTLTTIALLALTLAACAPGMPALTETPVPTATSTPLPPTPTATFEARPNVILPTTLPTKPTIALTPDPIQVEKWKEYEDNLGKKILSGKTAVLCEWEILGQSYQEVYAWAACDGVSVPAVIYRGADGSIRNVDVPGMSSDWGSDIRRMFPAEVREKFNYYQFGRAREMLTHLEYRRTHPDVPPLILLSAMPTATLTP
jgi:hypothetical protein